MAQITRDTGPPKNEAAGWALMTSASPDLDGILKRAGLTDAQLRGAGVNVSGDPPATPASLSHLGQAAQRYADRGWKVFPLHGIREGHCTCGKADCNSPGKHPRTKHSFKDASKHEKKIREWWMRWPDANIGYAVTGHVVFDADGEEGLRALAELEAQYGTLPETLMAKTGRGEHRYFQADGLRIRPSAGKIGEHFDIRAGGSYTILPPSVHASKKAYAWANHVKPVPLPAKWIPLLAEPERKPSGESSTAAKIPPGQRHAHLLKLAGSLRTKDVSEQAVLAACLAENSARCEPPKPPNEVRALAHDVCTRYPAGTPAKSGAQPSGETISLAKMRTFSDIAPEPLLWLWPGRIPLGKLTLIAGDPGLGKSLLTVDIAARVSTGASYPDGAKPEQGPVIVLSAEDDAADTIRPRLDAAGADISRVHQLDAVRNVTADGKSAETEFNLERDVAALEDALRQTGARLVIIDPISAYLGGTDSHANADVRGLLKPLAKLASKYKAAVIAVTHLRKSAGAAIYRTMGSLAFAAAGRAVWGVVADPDDRARRLFASIKQNLGPDGGGLAYRIETLDDVARIAWEPGAVSIDANILMGGFETREDHSERREAADWLRDFLGNGPQPVPEIQRQSRQAGLSWITIRRAADSLGIVKRKSGFGAGWQWSLAEAAHTEDAHPIHTEVSTFEGVTENKKDSANHSPEDAHSPMHEHLRKLSTFEDGQL
ncbi:MAG TPA: AAA family ATPase [Terriglobia bacterium]|nr:AAA family ATPase [Terriglobia bacterium]